MLQRFNCGCKHPFWTQLDLKKWDVVYKRALNPDGSLLFPEVLSHEVLEEKRREQGAYIFANQYMNTVVPDEERRFRSEWLRNYKALPEHKHTFAFIDPAIGQKDHHDYTAISVIDVDSDGIWYLRVANRYRLTPTEIVSKLFDLQDEFKCQAIGIESVAYQEALLYFAASEMRTRGKTLPLANIKRNQISKETRILSLVPRFEWGRILIAPGLRDFEDEYSTFPRAKHDDILDSIASLEELVFNPTKEKVNNERIALGHPDYERQYIEKLRKKAR